MNAKTVKLINRVGSKESLGMLIRHRGAKAVVTNTRRRLKRWWHSLPWNERAAARRDLVKRLG